MAVTAYVGEPGAGKTYEVVSEVILPALRTGRRVVSNIRGLNFDEMRAFLLVEEGVAEASIGAFRLVEVEEPGRPNFFCTDANKATTVQPGDLVVLDECWRWFAPGMPINPAMFEFFRMHRQFTDANGTSCDVVLISQSIQDIDRKVRVVVEKHFRMEKYKEFGVKKLYSVSAFNGYRSSRNAAVRVLTRKYNAKFFPFYKSYAGKGGDEREVDGRLSIFRGLLFKAVLPLALVFMVAGAVMSYRFFTGDKAKSDAAAKAAPKAALAAPSVEAVRKPALAVTPVESVAEWRAVGVVGRIGSGPVFVVEKGGRYRYLPDAPDFRLSGMDVKVGVDGKPATSWSGSSSSSLGASGIR